jgi:hypothetical protein
MSNQTHLLEQEELVSPVRVPRFLLERPLAQEGSARLHEIRVAGELQDSPTELVTGSREQRQGEYTHLCLQLHNVRAVLLVPHRLIDVHRNIADKN